MARWTEDREREQEGRHGGDDRRWREEGWRGREGREEERGGEWRGSERGDWRVGDRGRDEGQGGARGWEARDREWDRDRGRWTQGGGEWGGRGGMGAGDWDRERVRRGGERGGWSGTEEGHGRYGERGGLGLGWRGDEDRYGRGGGRGFEERESGFGREMRRQAGEEDPGAFERMGERMKEGWRRLTGKGPKGYKRSDERIREEVSERIARSWVDAEDVEVKVEGGEVTLTGLVRSRDEKRMLEDLAEDVFGVHEVNNHVKVRREEHAQSQKFSGVGQGTAAGAGQVGQRGQQTSGQPSGQQTSTSGQQPGQPPTPGARH